MEVIYARGRATAAEVRENLPEPPSYSAVRAMLRILEEKGHLKHTSDGPRYVFKPTIPREQARESALDRVVQTFFEGSSENAVAALLDTESLDAEALDRIARRIEKARREGR